MDDETTKLLDRLLEWEALERGRASPVDGLTCTQVEMMAGVFLQWLRYYVTGFEYDTARRFGETVRRYLQQEILAKPGLGEFVELREGSLNAVDPAVCNKLGHYATAHMTLRRKRRRHIFREP